MASVRMAPGAQPNAAERASVRLIELNQVVVTRKTLVDLILAFGLYPYERRRVPMEASFTQMRERDLHFTWTNSQPLTLSIAFAYPDKVKARAVLRELLDRMRDQSEMIEQRRGKAVAGIFLDARARWLRRKLYRAARAAPPQEAVRPWLLSNILIGVCSGALLGLLAAPAVRRPKWTLAMLGIGAGLLVLAPSYGIPNLWRRLAEGRVSGCR